MPNIISTLKQQCDGRWDIIIETLTDFTGKPSYCPQHHGKSGKAFYGKKRHYARTGITFCNTCGCQNDGINTLVFITNQSIRQVVKMLVDYLGGIHTNKTITTPTKTKYHRLDAAEYFEKAVKNINTLVEHSAALGKAKQYFINRGLQPLADSYYQDIRFAQDVSHYENESEHKHDAILGIMRDVNNTIRNVQRIFVDAAFNKAPCLYPKKMMPAPELGWHNGAAVWMKASSNDMPDVLHLSEGIENGHAVLNQSPGHTQMACCLTATNLTKFRLPANIRKLIIWADTDDALLPNGNKVNTGLDSAHKLKLGVESCGVQVIIIAPDKKGDWNDYPQQCKAAWDNIATPFIMM